jgi:hypothetical protein
MTRYVLAAIVLLAAAGGRAEQAPRDEATRPSDRGLAIELPRGWHGLVPRRIGLGGFSVEVPDGWSGFAKDLAAGDEEAPTMVVANVPWRDEGHNLAHSRPLEQFERLPPDGIVIAATAGSYPVGDPDQDPNAPVRLSDGHFIAEHYEGQPAPHVSIQIVSRPFGHAWVTAQVFFGRNEPTLGMRAQADAVLESLELG